ncbi:MAG: hypothetical protein GF341_01290 [candidate division Zixibacteria bacterium]|nr:hypothetical protein [candidate division Zixibacteria bacterium]
MVKFLNRDPIGEAGGVNLYGFVGNDPVNRWDYLGLDVIGDKPGFIVYPKEFSDDSGLTPRQQSQLINCEHCCPVKERSVFSK